MIKSVKLENGGRRVFILTDDRGVPVEKVEKATRAEIQTYDANGVMIQRDYCEGLTNAPKS